MTASTTSSGGDSTIVDSNINTPIVTHHCICCGYHRIGTNNGNFNEQSNAKTIGEEESADVSKTGREEIKRASDDDGDLVNISK